MSFAPTHTIGVGAIQYYLHLFIFVSTFMTATIDRMFQKYPAADDYSDNEDSVTTVSDVEESCWCQGEFLPCWQCDSRIESLSDIADMDVDVPTSVDVQEPQLLVSCASCYFEGLELCVHNGRYIRATTEASTQTDDLD